MIATAVILVATWGGTEYSWVSGPVLGLIAVAVVALAWFLRAERRAAEPMLPLHVFRNRNFSLTMALAFQVASLPHAVREIVFRAVAHGEDAVFLAVLPASIIVFVLALFIKQVPLRGRTPSENAPAPGAEALIG